MDGMHHFVFAPNSHLQDILSQIRDQMELDIFPHLHYGHFNGMPVERDAAAQ
jgi:hypothetical protein